MTADGILKVSDFGLTRKLYYKIYQKKVDYRVSYATVRLSHYNVKTGAVIDVVVVVDSVTFYICGRQRGRVCFTEVGHFQFHAARLVYHARHLCNVTLVGGLAEGWWDVDGRRAEKHTHTVLSST